MIPGKDVIAKPDSSKTQFIGVDSSVNEDLGIIVVLAKVY